MILAEDNVKELKGKLRTYKREDVSFNEPHFTQQLMLREGNREEVFQQLLNPDKLVYSYQEEGRYGDIKHTLHFEISGSRTMILPVILDPNNQKGLYVITYIMRHRAWHGSRKKGF